MKNAWKGLTVGALTGAAVGVVLDGLDKVGRRTNDAADRTRTTRPQPETPLAETR